MFIASGRVGFPFGYGFSRRGITIQYPYFVIVPPANAALDLPTVKKHLRIDADMTADDTYLQLIIKVVTDYAEKYTKRDFITRTYLTYRDNFFSNPITLRRSRFLSLVSFQYLSSNVLVNVPSNIYYITQQTDYSDILLLNNQSWPNDVDNRQQAVQITFTAGFGPNQSDIPIELQLAMMNHIAQIYENRGDCSGASCTATCSAALPEQAKLIYDMWRIKDLTTEGY